jgi:hypothetical protein
MASGLGTHDGGFPLRDDYGEERAALHPGGATQRQDETDLVKIANERTEPSSQAAPPTYQHATPPES